jgi:alanine racemase
VQTDNGSSKTRSWVEINLGQLRENFAIINADKPPQVKLLSVVKDNAYGHGAVAVAKIAIDAGAAFLAVVTIEEAIALRNQGTRHPILMLGERHESEFALCVEHDLTMSLGCLMAIDRLSKLAIAKQKVIPVHLKIDTGMSRYGVRWENALALVEEIVKRKELRLEGVMSHFAMSDELDKTFANLQLSRFQQVVDTVTAKGIRVPYRHLCNSGGLLDLPQAHFDMVRIGILPLGVYPSQVCRRIPGLKPVMAVKSRVAFLQDLQAGDVVGYGMRFTATAPTRIGVIPIGYGDGFPRVRNQGYVLIHGQRAPLVGGVSMDALTVDVTHLPEVMAGDEVVLMGSSGSEEISIHDIAKLKNSVSYDAMTAWRSRLPRVYLQAQS